VQPATQQRSTPLANSDGSATENETLKRARVEEVDEDEIDQSLDSDAPASADEADSDDVKHANGAEAMEEDPQDDDDDDDDDDGGDDSDPLDSDDAGAGGGGADDGPASAGSDQGMNLPRVDSRY